MANQSKFQQGNKEQKATNTYLPPIPIEKKIKDLKKGEYVTVKCKTDPTSASSTSYEINVQIFSGGNPEEFLRWMKNFYRAATGQGATTGPTKFALARRLLEGGTLTAFENAAKDEATETNDTLKTVLKKVTASVFPVKALQKQKRYMRRFFKKPGIMSIKAYVERVIEINEYLTFFPDPSSTLISTKLPDDELLDLLEFSIPRAWQKQMVLQGFDPIEGTTEEFVRFCEFVNKMMILNVWLNELCIIFYQINRPVLNFRTGFISLKAFMEIYGKISAQNKLCILIIKKYINAPKFYGC